MKVKRILKKLNYLPRWAWYLASLSIGGPIGPLFVYLGFHVLDKMAKDEEEDEAQGAFDWDVDIDRSGVHVRSRSAGRQSAPGVYRDADCVVTDEPDEDGLPVITGGHFLDLHSAVREALFDAYPSKVLCREDCAGLCPICGENRNDGPCACEK